VAARTKEVSIHRAYTWSHESESNQLELIRVFRIQHGLRRRARIIVAAAYTPPSTADEQVIGLRKFVTLAQQSRDFESIEAKYTVGPGRVILVIRSEELIRALTPRAGVLVR